MAAGRITRRIWHPVSDGRFVNRLAGARAVITGGGRGIGRAIALAFAAEGASVVVSARTEGEIEAVASEVRAQGGQAAAVLADITSDQDVQTLEASARNALGGPTTVLVNNAGIYVGRSFLDYRLDQWRRVLDVNVLGTVRVTRAFLPAMLEAGRGKIVNIASTAGTWGTVNQSAYNVSKHGIVGLTRCLALETADRGVRVNAVCPGWVDTDLVEEDAFAERLGVTASEVRPTLAARAPIGRMATPEEVAHLAVYLAADESDAVTGVPFTIAGGMVLV
jgi:meso-butanediol dehydrogenase / (S,S)-butanediol dehydrogenase / diacetyl reductase